MLVHIKRILGVQELGQLRAGMAAAEFVEGGATAGHQAKRVKQNQQIAAGSPAEQELGRIVLQALQRSPRFMASALPRKLSPPMFSRYTPGMTYGTHVDNAIRMQPRMRTDISATLFLCEPDSYEGGELVIEDSYGHHSVKFAAGDLVLYPSSSQHRVQPVARGTRDAAVLWVESMVRDERERRVLLDLDNSIQRLLASNAEHPEAGVLTACYHNLLRMWADT